MSIYTTFVSMEVEKREKLSKKVWIGHQKSDLVVENNAWILSLLKIVIIHTNYEQADLP